MAENKFEWMRPDIKLQLEAAAPELDTDECIRWTGLYLGTRPAIRVDGSTRSAIRLIYQRSFGIISQDVVVINTCNNANCVNPRHMKGATRSEIARKARRP